jgi:hypothetical protein
MSKSSLMLSRGPDIVLKELTRVNYIQLVIASMHRDYVTIKIILRNYFI